jgi:hypothetical protein
VRVGGREGPESVQFARGTAELERVERLIERLECPADIERQDAGGAEALVGCLGAIIDSVAPRPLPGLGHELLHGLEEVDVQAGEAVDALALP